MTFRSAGQLVQTSEFCRMQAIKFGPALYVVLVSHVQQYARDFCRGPQVTFRDLRLFISFGHLSHESRHTRRNIDNGADRANEGG